MLVDLFVAILQVKVSAANMWGTIFIEIMHVGVSVVIMQVLFSTVHYTHDYFYCSYAGDCLCCSYVTLSGKSNNKGIDNVPDSPAIFLRGNSRLDPEKSILMIMYSDTVKFKCCSSNRLKNAAG